MKLASSLVATIVLPMALVACTVTDVDPTPMRNELAPEAARSEERNAPDARREREAARQQFAVARDLQQRSARALRRQRVDEATRLFDELLRSIPTKRETLDSEDLRDAYFDFSKLADELGRKELAQRLMSERDHWAYRAGHPRARSAGARAGAGSEPGSESGSESSPVSRAGHDSPSSAAEAGAPARGAGDVRPDRVESPEEKWGRYRSENTNGGRFPAPFGGTMEQQAAVDQIYKDAQLEEARKNYIAARDAYIRALVLHFMLYGPKDPRTIDMLERVRAALRRMGYGDEAADLERIPAGQNTDDPGAKIPSSFGKVIVDEARRRQAQNDDDGARAMLEFFFGIEWGVLPSSANDASELLDRYDGKATAPGGRGGAPSGSRTEEPGSSPTSPGGSSSSGSGAAAQPSNSRAASSERADSFEAIVARLDAQAREATKKCDLDGALTARRTLLDQLAKTSSSTAADLHEARRQVLALLVLLGHDDEADRLEAEMRKADR